MRSAILLSLATGCGGTQTAPIDAAPSTDDRVPSLTTGKHTLEHGGLTREYFLYVPESLPEDAPLLIVMHGYSSSAKTIRDYSGFNDIAAREGFVVMYPQGTRDEDGYAFFHVGYAFHDDVTVDDVDFLKTATERVVQDLGLDAQAVFTTGMSNGGDMSYRLACETDWVYGIAPVAGTMLTSLLETCQPARPMPVLEIHGTEDDVTWYDGDPGDLGGWGAYLSMQEITDLWVEKNELTLAEQTVLPDRDTDDGSDVRFHRYTSSEHDAEFQLYEVRGGGHDWPGAWGNQDIEASELVWSFLAP